MFRRNMRKTEVMRVRFDKRDKVVKASDGLKNPLYSLTKAVVRAAKLKQSLVGTKEEVLGRAAEKECKER